MPKAGGNWKGQGGKHGGKEWREAVESLRQKY